MAPNNQIAIRAKQSKLETLEDEITATNTIRPPNTHNSKTKPTIPIRHKQRTNNSPPKIPKHLPRTKRTKPKR